MSHPVRSLGGLLLILLLFVMSSSPALAVGTTFRFSGSDLTIDANAKWIGCREGGYYPIRFRIRNIGPARTITLNFRQSNSSQQMPTVRRNVTIEQNATVNTSLLIPMVGYGNYGEVSVLENGRALKGFRQSVSLNDLANQYDAMPQMLVVNSSLEDGQKFSEAAAMIYAAPHMHYGGSGVECTETVEPSSLPTLWTAYTGLDLLAIPRKVFADDLSAETREAILTWVESGGWLIFYSVKDEAGQLDQLIDWNSRRFAEDKWNDIRPVAFRVRQVPQISDPSISENEEIPDEDRWKLEGFARERSLGFGQVMYLRDNPFPGSASHWAWLLETVKREPRWAQRNGFNARIGSDNFTSFLIPGVGGVPVISFLVLITIFTVVIGPLNYGYFLRKKRLSMLLVTVPALALGSSVLLLSYSTLANGFSVKSRVRSLTILDQAQQKTLSIARVAYYAGMAPSSGLTFAPSTAVYPLRPANQNFEGGTVNWSDTQAWENGWLRSRTRTQFLTVSQREQRGRLDVKPTDGGLQVSNGLEWQLEQLFVTDESGKLWMASSVAPGATVEMQAADDDARSRWRATLSENGLDPITGGGSSSSYGRYSPYEYEGDYPDYYNRSDQEQFMKSLLSSSQAIHGHMRSYCAILGADPDLDLGYDRARPRESLHLLAGFLD